VESKKQNPRTKAGARVDLAGGLEATNKKVQAKSTTEAEVLASDKTTVAIQLAKVLALLRQGPKTTIELRQRGIMMPAARVFQLKHEQDYDITTELIALYDPEGVRHRKCARYHMTEHPAAQGSLDLGGAQ
jgi:hypothetical protein